MSYNSNLECKVFVGDLPKDVSEQELEKEFSYYGRLKKVWVARNPPGFAFVEFEDPRDADDAIKGLDGNDMFGTRLRVEHSSGKSRAKPWQRGGRGPPPPRYRQDSRGFDPNDECFRCGRTGHYAYDCRSAPSHRRYGRSRSRSPRRRRSVSRSRSRDRYQAGRSRSRSRSPRPY